jgi:hypothetical protein
MSVMEVRLLCLVGWNFRRWCFGINTTSGGAERGRSLRPEQLLWTLGKKGRLYKILYMKNLKGNFESIVMNMR